MVRDEFYWLGQINKATLILNTREGLLKPEVAGKAAQALKTVLASGEVPANRVKRVIDFEPKLIEAAGTPAITEMHVGRSSQDMHSTFRAAILRDHVIAVSAALDAMMQTMLEMAREHQDTVLPSYTNGVAAQPTTFAHYLLGYLEGFKRDRVRLDEFYARLNHCPMGSCVLNGTGWPLNRRDMATFLGFESPTRNAFDATQISMVDLPLELAQVEASIALHIGEFIADVMVQYAQPRPWMLLSEGKTYVSSAMPQKRNPGVLINCRCDASDVVSDAIAVMTRAHNVPSGMVDGKSVKIHDSLAQTTVKTLERFTGILTSLVINKDRTLEELSLDWTASQEIADRLMSRHGLSFRVGHHVASGMVSYARANGILPLTFPYSEMCRIYAEVVAKEMPDVDTTCPMSEEEFRAALDPREIIQARRTEGSANPDEVKRMLDELDGEFNALVEARAARAKALDDALTTLDKTFEDTF